MAAVDYKKTQKELYQPGSAPSIVDVPEMAFVATDGRGDPNTSEAYTNAVQMLYGISFTIKMNKKWAGYFNYVVLPLEGFWSLDAAAFRGGAPIADKDKLIWTSLIRLPNFVTADIFQAAKEALAKKKPALDLSLLRLEKITEGLCVQAMHTGPYDDEPATITKMERYAAEQGYASDFTQTRRHHEIYLGDPRRTAPEKLKTVIRHPIRKA